MEKGRHRGEEAAVEMLAAGSGTEARVVESAKTVGGNAGPRTATALLNWTVS